MLCSKLGGYCLHVTEDGVYLSGLQKNKEVPHLTRKPWKATVSMWYVRQTVCAIYCPAALHFSNTATTETLRRLTVHLTHLVLRCQMEGFPASFCCEILVGRLLTGRTINSGSINQNSGKLKGESIFCQVDSPWGHSTAVSDAGQ